MGKLTVTAFTTLDNRSEDPHLWSSPYFNDAVGAFNDEVMAEADSLLLGRVTYEGFAAAWPERSGDSFSDKINAMPKYVVSSSLENPEWHDTTVLGADAIERIADLRRRENVLVWGSATLVAALTEAGLVDEFALVTSPLVLGDGAPYVPGGDAAPRLRVEEARSLDGGMVALRLTPAG